jgi:hypothetical protein
MNRVNRFFSGVFKLSASAVVIFSSSVALASGLPSDEDVAIHPISGETFILERGAGARGLTWLNDHDLAFEKWIALEDQGASEIELLPDGTLVVLSARGDFWSLRRFEPVREDGEAKLRPLSRFAELTGRGRVGGLNALPDGRLIVARAAINNAGDVLLIGSRGGETSKLEVLEEIPGEKFASAAAERAGSDEAALIGAGASASEGEGQGGGAPDAQPSPRDAATSPGMGFSAGALSGVGIAYRRHFANRWGIHVSGIAYGDATMVWSNVGVNFMRTMSLTARTRFYIVTGVAAFYDGSEQSNYVEVPACPMEKPNCDPYAELGSEWVNSVTLNFGAGIGMEFLLTKNLGLAIELPITIMLGISDSAWAPGARLNGIYPIPSGALIYYF